MVASIAVCPAVQNLCLGPLKKMLCWGKKSLLCACPAPRGCAKQGEPAAFETWNKCFKKKRIVASKHYKRLMLQVSMQVKKTVIKNSANCFVEHFKPHEAGWGTPNPQEGQKARKSFRHMHSYITLKKVSSIQEIHPCVGYSTLQDCCCAEKSKVSGFVDQIHLWTA